MNYEDNISKYELRVIPPLPMIEAGDPHFRDRIVPPRWWMWLLPWKWLRCLRYRKRTMSIIYTADKQELRINPDE